MDSKDYEKMLSEIDELRSILSNIRQEDLLHFCRTFWNLDEGMEIGLLAPTRQLQFLLGLYFRSNLSDGTSPLLMLHISRISDLLHNIFNRYNDMFIQADQPEDIDDERWIGIVATVQPSFAHFFQTIRVFASAEDVRHRFLGIFSSLESLCAQSISLTPCKAMDFCDRIVERLTGRDDISQALLSEIEAKKKYLTQDAKTRKQRRAALRSPEIEELEEKLHKRIADIQFQAQEIVREGEEEDFDRFLALFTNAFLAENKSSLLPTDSSYLTVKPLFHVKERSYTLINDYSLYRSVSDVFESSLSRSEFSAQYFRTRDLWLEREACLLFRQLAADNGDVFEGLSEQPNGINEHDLVVTHEDKILFIECKAAPMPEPFRDPKKSFTRIIRDFRSKGGIQGGYQQTMRLWRKWNAGQSFSLYKDGKESVKVSKNLFSKCYCVVLSDDHYGPIAVNLKYLLEKNHNEPYPWATNQFDLRAIIDAWHYRGWGIDEFLLYLDHRQLTYENTFAGDELEYAGIFLREEGLISLIGSHDLLTLGTDCSSIFDDIYFAKKGGPAPDFSKRLNFKQLNPDDARRIIGR